MMNVPLVILYAEIIGLIGGGSGSNSFYCRLATTGNLTGFTYDNGDEGAGATLTAVSTGVLSVDGVAASVGDKILVRSQSTPSQNGIYSVTVNAGGVAAVLTRSINFDTASKILEGSEVTVLQGSTLAATQWIMNQTDTIIVGTTAITFVELSISGALLAALNLSDLANNLTALNNLQLPNGVQVITSNANIAFVNTGGNNTTTFNIAGAIYINNNAASGVTINAKLPPMNSTTAGQKSIAVGQSILIVNLSINPDTETHPIEVQDDAAAGLETIQTNQLVVCTLIDNSTAAGVWGTYVIGNAAWYNVTDSDSLNYPKIPTMKTGTKTTDNLVTISNDKGSVQDSGFPVSSLITQDTLTTTNASFNAISNIALAVNTGKKIIAKVVGKKVGSVDSAWATLDITVSRAGGDITLIGTPVFNKDASTTEDVQYTIDTGLDALIIEVKGVSTDTYKWSCQYSTQLISD